MKWRLIKYKGNISSSLSWCACKYDCIKEIADKHNLFLLEDCALAPGAYHMNKHVGLHGDVGVFSFYPVKHITQQKGNYNFKQ